MVLGGEPPGRVGRRRNFSNRPRLRDVSVMHRRGGGVFASSARLDDPTIGQLWQTNSGRGRGGGGGEPPGPPAGEACRRQQPRRVQRRFQPERWFRPEWRFRPAVVAVESCRFGRWRVAQWWFIPVRVRRRYRPEWWFEPHRIGRRFVAAAVRSSRTPVRPVVRARQRWFESHRFSRWFVARVVVRVVRGFERRCARSGGSTARGGPRKATAGGRRRAVDVRRVADAVERRAERGAERGRSTDARREREEAPRPGKGFGPYAVDQRDEETREKRGRRSADATTETAPAGRSALRTVGKRTDRTTKARPLAAPRPGAPAVVGASAGRPTCSRSWPSSPAATPAARWARSWPRPTRSPTTASARRCASCARCATSSPTRPSVRELTGLCQYRVGNYAAAAKELEAYADLSDSVDQHPVLMDCYRAQRRWRKVEELWQELAAVSPTSELVTEGRIVYAGALADQGRLPEALALLRKRAERDQEAGGAPAAPLVRARRPRGAGRQPRPGPGALPRGAHGRPGVRRRRRAPRRARMSVTPAVVGSRQLPRTTSPSLPVPPVDPLRRREVDAMSTSTKPSDASRRAASRRQAERPAESPGVNLAVLCGPCSGPAEVRVLESGTRLATLAVRCPAGPPPTTGHLGAGHGLGSARLGRDARRRRRGRRRGPDAPALLPASRRGGLPGRRRGRARSGAPATAAASTPRCARPTRRSRSLGRDRRRRPVTLPATTCPLPSRRARAPSVRSNAQLRFRLRHEPTQRGEGRVTATPETQPLEPATPRRSRHPVRRRLRRRHAAHRRPLHRRQRRVRQRPGDDAELPGGDPRPGRHHRRRLVVPGAHLRPRHRHARRRAERAGGDEPRGAQGQPVRAAAGLHDPGQLRRVRRAQPHQGRLRRQPARQRVARRRTTWCRSR